ncbi:MAG: DUF6084 family protein [Acidimicrobiales bacterium]
MSAGLAFEAIGSRVDAYAAQPTIVLRLRISTPEDQPVHALSLACQIRIEPQRRTYSPAEEERLYELFGHTPQWGDTLRPFLWTHVSAMVSGFRRETEIDLAVPCTYDMEVAGVRYLHSLAGGELPLVLLFSGTAFGAGTGAGFSARPVSWSDEASFLLPVQTWRDMMDAYFPNSGWLRLSRDALDGLARFKGARGLATWEQAVECLLKEAGEP